ncbi:MAG: tetratricopeptide repeat protein [bacterium]|nr:tetratricopeptide repeat protein [bacterium]
MAIPDKFCFRTHKLLRATLVSALILLFFSVPLLAMDLAAYNRLIGDGSRAREKKDFKAAEAAYRGALKEVPRSEEAMVGLLYTFIEKEDYIQAEKVLAEIRAINPLNIRIRKGAAWTFYMRGRYADAVDEYRFILDESGNNSEIRLGLGLSLLMSGKADEAHEECLKCKDDFKNDSRMEVCLAEQPSSWTLKPQLYLSYMNYTDAVKKTYSFSVSGLFEIFHSSGFGMLGGGSLLVYPEEFPDNSVSPPPGESPPRITTVNTQFSSDLAFYYIQKEYFLWSHWSFLADNSGGDANVFSLYGNVRFGFLHAGSGFSTGLYNDFDTFQFSPELGIYFAGNFLIKGSLMIQQSTNSRDIRYSPALDLEARFKKLTLLSSFYLGKRWHTVEDNGLVVWNSDEEFTWGGKVKTFFLPGEKYSPFLSLRLDKAWRQDGEEQVSYTSGITAGIIFNF